MKTLITLLFFMSIVNIYGQITQKPTNIDEAIHLLDESFSDSLKHVLKNADGETLYTASFLVYGEMYKEINSWFGRDTGIVQLFNKDGVRNWGHIQFALLSMFKQHLQGEKVDYWGFVVPLHEIEEGWGEENIMRYTTDTINGTYIPKDIKDCLREIDSFWNDSTKAEVKAMEEDEFVGKTHLYFGLWIRNNWCLWSGSRLSKYFYDLDIRHPDDMSGIILNSYHRHLSGKDIDLENQISFYHKFWKASAESNGSRIKEELSHYHIGDTVQYNCTYGFVSDEQKRRYDTGECTIMGKIVESDKFLYKIKVQLLTACDASKTIISYDNSRHIWRKDWIEIRDRNETIIYQKEGESNWFDYLYWNYPIRE